MTFGGGTEVALDARWSAKLEYLYIDAGKTRASYSGVEGGAPFTNATDVSNRFHVVRASVNYSFNGPVVAKHWRRAGAKKTVLNATPLAHARGV